MTKRKDNIEVWFSSGFFGSIIVLAKIGEQWWNRINFKIDENGT